MLKLDSTFSNGSTKSNPPKSFSHDYYRFNFVFNYIANFGFVAHGLLIFIFLFLGIKEMALYNVLSSISWFFVYRVHKKEVRIAYIIGYIEILLHATLAVYYVGWNTGYHYFIFGTVTGLFYMPYFKSFTKIIIAAGSTFMYLLLFNLFKDMTPIYILSDKTITYIYYLNIVITFAIFSFTAYFYNLAAKKAESKLQELNNTLQLMATTDHLTGIANRRSMISSIEKVAEKYKKDGQRFSLIIADIDDFKKINDQYGHNCGDNILQSIAEILKKSLRKNDTIARWGGEEFLILLPQTNYEEAAVVAKKLKRSLKESYFDCLDDGESLTMTFGISEYKDSLDKCISEADTALYRGKRNGKDCVVIYN